MDLTYSLNIEAVNKALDGLAQRNLAITSNLANVDTPNYHRRSVAFEESLQQAINTQKSEGNVQASNDIPLAMRTVSPDQFSPATIFTSVDQVHPQITEAGNMSVRPDGNSVDVENEMAQLAKTTQKYMALASIEKRMLQGLQSDIKAAAGGG